MDSKSSSIPNLQVILLNYDFTFLNIISWKRAIQLIVEGKATIIEKSNRIIRNISRTVEIYIPKILKLSKYIKIRPRNITRLSRKNIFLRDNNKCQYCGSTKDLTIDHVIPISKGGKNEFKNLVSCCRKCNNLKGGKTPEEAGLKLIKKPYTPTFMDLVYLRSIKLFASNQIKIK